MKGLYMMLVMAALMLPSGLQGKTTAMQLLPKDKAVGVCVDTHLTLTFQSEPTLGTKGMIWVWDAATGEKVDSLDVSIPSGPTEPRTYGPECDYTKVPYDYTRSTMATNKTVRPGTPSGGAEATPPCYQLNIIGGFTDAFHFRPVIIHGCTATIYLHNNMLEYGHTYKVSIDKSVFQKVGFKGVKAWTFTTKKACPQGREITVDGTGKGDFCTVQGALDYIPDNATRPYYIKVAAGDYEEIVYARNKKNVVITGAGMDKTRVHYANCEVFNPHPLTLKTNERPGTFPSRRAAFMLDNCQDIILKDITIATDMQGQAEGLLVNGERIAMYRVHIIGSGDAMQGNGTIYMERCEMDGGGDTFLGRGAIFLYRCNLRNDGGPFTWIRNTEGHHGDVFVECSFGTNNDRKVDFGRCPDNHGKGYPYAEQVLIRCTTTETIPEGWSAIGNGTTSNFCEYDTRDAKTGKPVDVTGRHKFSHQLDAVKDAEKIKNYSTPSYVLNGWTPSQTLGAYDEYYTDMDVDIQRAELPEIPDLTVNVKDYGAVGDGLTLTTEAIQKAIDDVAQRGGGHVVVPAGVWLFTTLELKSCVDLHLEHNALLQQTFDKSAYKMQPDHKRLYPAIHSENAHDISVTGYGIVDGAGRYWRPVKRGKMSDVEWNRYVAMGGEIVNDGTLWMPYNLKHVNNVTAKAEKEEALRSDLFRPTRCNRVLLKGVTFQDSPRFTIHPCQCQNVIIDGVTARSMWNVQNADGIDLSNCRKCLIVNCFVDCGDDGICMKSGSGAEGVKNGPCQDILVQDCKVAHAHGGFVFGSDVAGGMDRILVRRCMYSSTDVGLRFKSALGRGGKTTNVVIQDIVMTDITNEAIVFDCGYFDARYSAASSEKNDKKVKQDKQTELYAPDFQGMLIERVTCRESKVGVKAKGMEGRNCVHDITIRNSSFFYRDKATDIDTNTADVKLENCTLRTFDVNNTYKTASN